MSSEPSLVGVILAAGASTRMGVPKALLGAGGRRTFLESVGRVLRRAGAEPVLVVVGSSAVRIAARARALGYRPVFNRNWRAGQLSSARIGLRAALRSSAERIILCPVDLPRLAPDVGRAVARAARRAPGRVVIPVNARGTGHPIVLPRGVAAAVARDDRSASLREALVATGTPVLHVRVRGPGIADVVNTPSEYRKLFRKDPQLVPAR